MRGLLYIFFKNFYAVQKVFENPSDRRLVWGSLYDESENAYVWPTIADTRAFVISVYLRGLAHGDDSLGVK